MNTEKKYIVSFKSGKAIKVDQQTINIIGKRIISPEGAKKFQVFSDADSGGDTILLINVDEIESISGTENIL